jgi:hypothetical protein
MSGAVVLEIEMEFAGRFRCRGKSEKSPPESKIARRMFGVAGFGF